MCTSLAFKTDDFYFGRNMDLDYHFGEGVTITPRGYTLALKHEMSRVTRYAIIGMATVQNGFPLYAEGTNENGLCISALSFEGEGEYGEPMPGRLNLASFEIIPFILATCASVDEANRYLKNVQITNAPFSDNIPPTQLHWHIADKYASIVLESTKNGVKIYENSTGVLTNAPTFDYHLKNFALYNHLRPAPPSEKDFSLGLSMIGLPGDFSSTSRFVKLAVLNKFVKCEMDEASSVATVIRLMQSVSPLRGTTLTKKRREHYTTYTCVINATRGIYYYTTPNSIEINRIWLNEYADKEGINYIKI